VVHGLPDCTYAIRHLGEGVLVGVKMIDWRTRGERRIVIRQERKEVVGGEFWLVGMCDDAGVCKLVKVRMK
jgi:hypothetical protein